jgi:hypothetical protein
MISSDEKRETVKELINRATFEIAFITRNSERLAEEKNRETKPCQ